MKKVLFLFALLLLVVGIILFVQNYSKTGGTISFFKKNPTVTINTHTFNVKVADTPEKREIGLSDTNSLPENQGMIFIFDKPDLYNFWMKDMKFSIDIIYINNGQIVTILNNVVPPIEQESPKIYTPTEPSDKVLEIKSGLSEKYNFKQGDKVQYENLSD